ncbi:MAG: 23S rRNA (adenine(2503)-C(2))-methyltransferase RlmN [Gammaproteobacteria bacterium]|nr:23S rRNA (adenine(2503)-C(2))-methyltransferase RlmN [Gammaproteobacteria bacterium]
MSEPHNLMGLDAAGLRQFLEQLGEPSFRSQQLLQWIHQRGITDFALMSNLSKSLRERLAAVAVVAPPEVAFDSESSDGTRKWLFHMGQSAARGSESLLGNAIETVYIPETRRATLCISSQVGCSLDCSFCSTARQGFNRNLTTAEIIGQVWTAERLLKPTDRRITNVVLMGMGEPLINYENVVPALKLMIDDLAYGLAKRRVTVSTAGVVPAIYRLRDEQIEVALAISLHAPNDSLRNELVPLNTKYPIEELLEACSAYIKGLHKRQITFEYVMLDGVNDSPVLAKELARRLEGIPSKLNLIPFNPFPGSGYRRSNDEAIGRFMSITQRAGIVTTVRKTRGDDIDAACGQLVGQVADRSRREKRFIQPRFGEKQTGIA